MPFKKKDNRINRNGRPKGSKNKIPYDLREKIVYFLNENFELIQKEFDKLEPKDKVRFFIDLIQYSIPKYQSIQMIQEKEEHEILKIEITQEDKNNLDELLSKT
ncbi:MAG: hypothetical protein L3J56_13995 [Bacteroidales bacterium]|nr:hypothetical protein [Bacteroidales bacterium]